MKNVNFQEAQDQHPGAKIHILSENSHVQNKKFQEIHIFKIAFLPKYIFFKSQF